MGILKLPAEVEIREAMNGLEAVQTVREDIEQHDGEYSSFVFIMMDCNMPFMDGCTATKEIRSLIHASNLR